MKPLGRLERVIMWFLDFRTAELQHPRSPCVNVPVVRSRFGRIFKPSAIATMSEALKSGITWKKMGKTIEDDNSIITKSDDELEQIHEEIVDEMVARGLLER